MTDCIHQKETQQHVRYSIAGLFLEVIFPNELQRLEILPSFEPFLVEDLQAGACHCTVEIEFSTLPIEEEHGKLLSDVSVVWGERFSFYEQADCYITTIRSEHEEGLWKMRSSKDFSRSTIQILNDETAIDYILNWLIMVAFGQTSLLHHTVLIHASVVDCKGAGYAFLGKSGTGKSTHSRLWLQHIQGAELLNDDNPAIRLERDGQVYVYGTPWSGKTPCYRNKRIPLRALVRLKQADHNRISIQNGVHALVGVLPSCTAIRWNKVLFNEMTNTVQEILQKVQVAELECLPNKEAALLCYNEIMNR